MNRLLEVCLVALTVTTSVTPSVAAQFPPLQKGISVKMAVTRNAVPWPDADQADALVVAITHDGRVFLGIDPVTPVALAEGLKADLSSKPEKKLYVKADARTRYAHVEKVLNAARRAGVESLILLTAQPGAVEPGVPVPSYGLEVRVAPPQRWGSEAAAVQILPSGQRHPGLMVNSQHIPGTSLQTALGHLSQNRTQKVVLVKADGTLPFADVVEVTDTCRSMGAEVILVKPGP